MAQLAGLASLFWIAGTGHAEAQLGSLLSPGKLSRAHGKLEGIRNCTQCHEQGQKVTAEKCLACHRPVADRIARKLGVHKNVKNDCVSCHAEHAGVDGEVRPFDQSGFDHPGVTGFALDGKHAPLARQCAACHKVRSFLTLSPGCVTCHDDVHKGRLGPTCTSCHSTKTAFKDLSGQFDHSKARFALDGAHQKVACEKCHVNRVFRGLKFTACTDCHRDPHRGEYAPTCKTCHTSDTWRTKKVDHTRTLFPLRGKHTTVACALCHKQPAMQVKPKSETCASCHVDVHKGAFKQDCKSCHSESGFEKAPFDHGKTAFPLEGKHEAVTCSACHKGVVTAGVPVAKRVADFRGLKTACASCHTDVHKGELGAACETCHSPKTFQVTTYTHPRFPDFFAGEHAPVVCGKCHKGMMAPAASGTAPAVPLRSVPAVVRSATATPLRGAPPAPLKSAAATAPSAPSPQVVVATFKNTPMTCASCHDDVHLGQVGRECQTCHSVAKPKFGVVGFDHSKTSYPLTGSHAAVTCVKCHKKESGTYPAGTGTAVRFKVAKDCRGCHEDVHLGQFKNSCETCHSTRTFKFTSYTHLNRSLSRFFVGRHVKAACAACHKPVTATFPLGRGTAVRFNLDNKCVACHQDVHRGSLGPNCIECHRP